MPPRLPSGSEKSVLFAVSRAGGGRNRRSSGPLLFVRARPILAHRPSDRGMVSSRFRRKHGESRKYGAVLQNASPRKCVPKNSGVSGGSENGPRASHHDRVPPRRCPSQACVGVRPFGTCPGLFAGFGTTVGIWLATMLCICESMNAKMPVWRPSGSALNQSSHP